jgi:serpin B
MGLKAPFARGADFTGIDDGVNELFVNMILQRVVVDVNEKGFEGAAASAAMVVPGSAPPKPTTPVTVVVDRPFLFLVEHRVSGALLFYGAISDPTSS